MTHIMPAKTDLKEQTEGRKNWQVVAMFPVGGVQQPQMHIPLVDCDTKEECEQEILKLQDLVGVTAILH
jgi:hypothetical protein